MQVREYEFALNCCFLNSRMKCVEPLCAERFFFLALINQLATFIIFYYEYNMTDNLINFTWCIWAFISKR